MGLTKYYESICERYPILTPEEERRLLNVYFGKDSSESERRKARDVLICSNLRYVFKKAKRYSRGNVEQFEDLIAAGNEGLLVGLDKYDKDSDVRLLTYAGWWVMQRQLKEMSKWRLVALPAQKQQLATKIKKYIDSHEGFPSLEELQEEFPQASVKDLKELSHTQYITFYLDNLKTTKSLVVHPIDDLVENMENDRLVQAIAELPPLEAEVVKMTYGLTDGVERKPSEIVREIGDPKVTTAVVKRALASAHDEIRRVMEDGYGWTTISGGCCADNPTGYMENDWPL